VATAVALSACRTPSHAPVAEPGARPVQLIAVAGPLARADAEISGMAWHGDTLVLLPQYPERFGSVLFTFDKSAVLAALDGRAPEPLTPGTIRFVAPEVQSLAGYEGFESIAFVGDHAVLTIEASPHGMLGHILAGNLEDGGKTLRVDMQKIVPIEPPVQLSNVAYEALLAVDGGFLTFFEANGARVNPHAVAPLFAGDLTPRGTIPMPAIEYRITDATPLDGHQRFWVSNSFYVRDTDLLPDVDHSVEQLLELQWTGHSIERTSTPPIRLQRLDDRTTRNWEGLARLDDRGFLLATDRHPETLFGFVENRPAH
jgi:hypothetical protein